MCDNQNGRYFHSVTLEAFSPYNSLVGIIKDQRFGPKMVAGHPTRNGKKDALIIIRGLAFSSEGSRESQDDHR